MQQNPAPVRCAIAGPELRNPLFVAFESCEFLTRESVFPWLNSFAFGDVCHLGLIETADFLQLIEIMDDQVPALSAAPLLAPGPMSARVRGG